MAQMEKARAGARQRRRQEKSHQRELFPAEQVHDPTHYNSLRDRYLRKARDCVLRLLRCHHRVLYDNVWQETVPFPLTWESDLKEWLREWQDKGFLCYEGMRPRQRVPKRQSGVYIVWDAPQGSARASDSP